GTLAKTATAPAGSPSQTRRSSTKDCSTSFLCSTRSYATSHARATRFTVVISENVSQSSFEKGESHHKGGNYDAREDEEASNRGGALCGPALLLRARPGTGCHLQLYAGHQLFTIPHLQMGDDPGRPTPQSDYRPGNPKRRRGAVDREGPHPD